jgi:hypothetical protein
MAGDLASATDGHRAGGSCAAREPSSPGGTARTRTQRFGRHAVLVTPLMLVNAAAVYGQVQWATVNLTRGSTVLAVLFAMTVESIAVYLAYEAHAALLAGDASFRLRAASYVAAGLVGALNYSHFAGPGLRPTAAALAFGGLSSISPWLWSIRSRSLRRDQLRAAGLIDPRSAHFAAAKWVNYPIRTLRAYRWSVDHGMQEERAAWEAYRAARHRRRAGASAHTNRVRADEHISRGLEPARVNGSRNGRPQLPPAAAGSAREQLPNGDMAAGEPLHNDLRDRVHEALASGERVTGETIAGWLGVSPRTGRRRLALLIDEDPALSDALARE